MKKRRCNSAWGFGADRHCKALDRLTAEGVQFGAYSQCVSKELDLWVFLRGVTLDFSRPGKPTDNAYIESLNGMFRAECLNANWFMSLDEARRKCEAWRRDYNELRPHSALGQKVPKELHLLLGPSGQPSPR